MPHHEPPETIEVGDLRPAPVPTSGPHVLTTIGRPIRPEAKRAYDAMIQKDLRKRDVKNDAAE